MIYAENILLCIAVPLLLSMVFVRTQARRYVLALVTGMIACLLAAYITGFLRLLAGWEESEARIFLSPVVEEIVKLIPLLVLLLLLEPRDDVILLLAVALGAGFATFENCCSLFTSGAASLPFVIIRGLAVGVMHIVSVAALAMGIVAARRLEALSLPGLAGAFSLSVTFHGLYNLLVSAPGISTYIGYGLPLLAAAALYVPYRRFRLPDEEAAREAAASRRGEAQTNIFEKL